MKNEGIIYKVTHKQSGRVYIGCTKINIHERKLDHISRMRRDEKGAFQEAIGTYGANAFTWEQIDTANSVNDLAQKEKDYIKKYDSVESGFNQDSGGGFKKNVYQYSIPDGKLIGKYDCLQSAANAVSVAKQNISMACLGGNKTCKGYWWSYSSSFLSSPIQVHDNRKKEVHQLTLELKFVKKYNSVAEASKNTGISKSCIAKCCRGERKTSKGFKWKYI